MAKVVVLGGGVAGLSAAHELAERGFEVVLIEKTGIPGGKARSSPVLPLGQSPWKAEPRYPSGSQHASHVNWVPGEHGFRFFPGFYKHVVDTMSRIPAPDGVSAAEHLVSIGRCGLTQYDKPTFNFPMRFTRTPGDVFAAFTAIVAGFSSITELTAHELGHFFARIWQIMTSCEERRLAEYEKVAWWEFIDASAHSAAYQKFLATGITRSLVAAKAKTANTRTIGNIFIQLLLDIIDPLVATSDRVLDGPTNQVWIYPWLQHVRALGVTYMRETAVTEILYDGKQVAGVRTQSGSQSGIVHGDYYVCALPLERVVPLLSRALVSGDPALANLRELNATSLEWMNGVQFYFRTPVRLVRGHMNHIDTEWALTSVSQVDVWRTGTMDRYGPSNIEGIVSVDVSDWRAPAASGRTAMEHSREEVCREVWRQLKRSVNTAGQDDILRDDELIGWFIDSDIDRDPSDPALLANSEPLLVNLADTWKLRPAAATAIRNFFLASDYVRTHTDLATMEAANEAARRAVNGILDAEGFAGPPCRIWALHEPLALQPLRAYDAVRFGAGLPWDSGTIPVATSALRAADPLLKPLAEAMAVVSPVLVRVQETVDALEHGIDLDETVAQALEEHVGGVRDAAESAVPVSMIEDAAIAVGQSLPPAVLSRPDIPGGGRTRPDSGPHSFAERLEWYRSMTMAAVQEGIPVAPPQSFLYEPIREFVSRPSKGIRPALCLASCLAHGGRVEDALPSAAAIELLHNAFLVHDDIEDGSESRRGQPVLHRMIGTPLAINVGDAMNALAMRLFRSNVWRLGPEPATRVFDEVDHMLMESLEGQALELGWVRENNCQMATDDYLRLVLKKTAWYSFIHPLRIGAIAAGMGDGRLERFNRFGFLLGAAFQIQDDVLNLIGDEGRYGKEIGGDLWEGKRTLPIAHALLRSSLADRTLLRNFLGRPREERLPRHVFEVQRILTAGGSIAWATAAADGLARAAEQELPAALADAAEGPDRAFIEGIVRYLVERDL